MNYDDFCRVNMWLAMEEVRAHQSVTSWKMVYGVVVFKVGDSGGLVNLEVSLAGAIPDPVEAHVY